MPSATYGFNGKPNSVQKGNSGSYTIPANNFAWVTISCKNGGTITLDGTTALASDGAAWNALARGIGNLWMINGDPIYGTLAGGSASPTTWRSESTFVTTNATATLTPEFGRIASGGDAAAATTYTVKTNYAVDPIFANAAAKAYNAVSAGLWVPTGTVISGTGNYSYTASLFTG